MCRNRWPRFFSVIRFLEFVNCFLKPIRQCVLLSQHVFFNKTFIYLFLVNANINKVTFNKKLSKYELKFFSKAFIICKVFITYTFIVQFKILTKLLVYWLLSIFLKYKTANLHNFKHLLI